MPADLITLAHEGSKAYSNTFELVHRREADGPNAIWQADHTPLDIELLRPDGKIGIALDAEVIDALAVLHILDAQPAGVEAPPVALKPAV